MSHYARFSNLLNAEQFGISHKWRRRPRLEIDRGKLATTCVSRRRLVSFLIVLTTALVLSTALPDNSYAADPSDDSAKNEKSGVPRQLDGTTNSNATRGGSQPKRSSSEMAKRVDQFLAEHWKRNGVKHASRTTDNEFLRRVYLDLTGRIPSVSEVYEFADDSDPNRRVHLVDHLLSHRDHASHLATVWRRILLPDGADLTRYGGTAGLDQWLVDHFIDNVSYDRIVRKLLMAEGRVTKSGPVLFYTALKLSPEEIASQTARAFLGMRMECAQCHDHPFDERWSQQDFWGYAAFFARISRPQGKLEMVSSVMRVRDNNRGDVTLPDSDEIVPPRFPQGELLDEQDGAKSRRQELADWMTQQNSGQLARATVNRVWAHLFGLGLVEPVDDMRPDNPAVCPEVLDELTQYFVATGFDLKKLFRTVVSTDAYQLSSRATENDPDRQRNFAQMNIKSFTAEQLYDCIAMATRLQAMQTSQDGQESLMRFDNYGRRAFLEQFRAPPGQPTEYHSGIPQALTLMNGGLVNTVTDVSRSGLLNSLPPFFSDQQRVETLFLSTLSRKPNDDERTLMLKYMKAAESEEEKQKTLGNILWALLNSAEFTLNH